MGQEWCNKFYKRFVSKRFVPHFIELGISANQITLFSHMISLTVVVYCFSRGSLNGNILGLFFMCIVGMLDYIDGDIARATGTIGELGKWFDSVFDVIIQNAILAAIAVGCFKQGLNITWIALYFVGNAALNLVSFHYNATFNFTSAAGDPLFRKYMDYKATKFNRAMKNLIDPTSSWIGLGLYTCRYWIVMGVATNQMPIIFMIITVLTNFRWIIMYVLYAFHLKEYKKLWVSQALAIIDKDRQEYYERSV